MWIHKTKTEARKLARDARAALVGTKYRKHVKVQDHCGASGTVVMVHVEHYRTSERARIARALIDRLVTEGFNFPEGTERVQWWLQNEMAVAIYR
jgi:hypothetical protein